MKPSRRSKAGRRKCQADHAAPHQLILDESGKLSNYRPKAVPEPMEDMPEDCEPEPEDVLIRKFDVKLIAPGDLAVGYGNIGDGKTTLARELIKLLYVTHAHIVLVSGVYFNGDFSGIIPSNYMHDELTDDLILRILMEQVARRGKKVPLREKSLLLVIDDAGDRSTLTTKAATHLLRCRRQYNITIIFTCQFIKILPPLMRKVITFSFVFKEARDEDIDTCYNLLVTGVKKKEFKELNRQLPKYVCLVFNYKSNGDVVSIYKANYNFAMTAPIRFGDARDWQDNLGPDTLIIKHLAKLKSEHGEQQSAKYGRGRAAPSGAQVIRPIVKPPPKFVLARV